jgi:hypothetical protein
MINCLLFVSDYWRNVNLSGNVIKYKKKENRLFNYGEICDLLSIFTWQNKNYLDLGIVFKQSFKYLKNEKINLSKVILKLECLFYLNIYILFYLILYSKSHFYSNKSKKRSNRKKTTPYTFLLDYYFEYCV